MADSNSGLLVLIFLSIKVSPALMIAFPECVFFIYLFKIDVISVKDTLGSDFGIARAVGVISEV